EVQDKGPAWPVQVPHDLQAWRLRGHCGRLLRAEGPAILILPRQKGLPYSFYHGRTGIVFNVNSNALGVEMTKIIGNRRLRKRIHVRIEHVRKSRCAESFLRRVKENDQKKRDARLQGKSIVYKRVPQGPKEMKIVKAKPEDVEVLAPLPFVENYF
ncbi:unnamed protein product, partial [Polarella glacialis]